MEVNIAKLSHPNGILKGTIDLEGSKSISNRVLLIQALCEEDFGISNLSISDDTTILQKSLQSLGSEINVGHAGTSFRFLTAYLSLLNGTYILTGSDRMKERPIGPLVNALRSLGMHIDYLENDGFPPLQIHSPTNDLKNEVDIDASVSSQFISALCLIAPTLPMGLKINLKGDLVSKSYLQMTLKLMEYFGVQHTWDQQTISINAQKYQPKDIRVEADWSAASYYFSLAALSKQSEIKLTGLNETSIQGDAAIVQISENFGLTSIFDGQGLLIKKDDSFSPPPMIEYDFLQCPDIAQTVSVMSAGLGTSGLFTGLQTLKNKETNRTEALGIELLKFGVFFNALPSKKFAKNSGNEYFLQEGKTKTDAEVSIMTYKDHRMAMAFAPLALLHPLSIEKPNVVTKSYPGFWKDLESLGFSIDTST